MKDGLELFFSWFIAVSRLILLCFILLVEGLHHILFTRSEVCAIVLKVIPLRVDRDKISYVENLAMNNLDLMASQDEYYEDEEGNGGDLGEQ